MVVNGDVNKHRNVKNRVARKQYQWRITMKNKVETTPGRGRTEAYELIFFGTR